MNNTEELRKSVGVLLAHPDQSGIWLSERLPKDPPSKFDGCIATPGGKVDPGESLEDAIRRETEEESGVILDGDLTLVDSGVYEGSLGRYQGYHFFATSYEIPEDKEPHKHGPWTFYRTEELHVLRLMESTRNAISVALNAGLLKVVERKWFETGEGLPRMTPAQFDRFCKDIARTGHEICETKWNDYPVRLVHTHRCNPNSRAVARMGPSGCDILIFGRHFLRQSLVHEIGHALDMAGAIDQVKGAEERQHFHGITYEEMVVALMDEGWVSGPKRFGLFNVGRPDLALEIPEPNGNRR